MALQRGLFLVLVLLAAAARAEAPTAQIHSIRIDLQYSDDCRRGQSWMGINISVRTDRSTIHRREHAACGYTLQKRFEEDGVECRITSGMCSSFYPRGEVRVECRERDGYRRAETASFPCPER